MDCRNSHLHHGQTIFFFYFIFAEYLFPNVSFVPRICLVHANTPLCSRRQIIVSALITN